MTATNYDAVSYKKNYIKEAIIRLDFPAPLPNLSTDFPQSVANAVIANFPLAETRKTQAHSLEISEHSVATTRTDVHEWIYHGLNREKSFIIGPDAAISVTRDYSTFEKFLSESVSPINALFDSFPDLRANRVGLRYVNFIEDGANKSATDWSTEINPKLLSIIDFHPDKAQLARAFSSLNLNFDGLMINFQFGIANPDFPAPIKRRQFIIDIDGYTVGSYAKDEVSALIKDAHARVQDIFELSITLALKQQMLS